MMNIKRKSLATAIAAAMGLMSAQFAHAAINLDNVNNGLGSNTFADPNFDGTNTSIGGVGELFVSIIARDLANPNNSRSYVRDLGIGSKTFVTAFEAGTLGTLNTTISADANLQTFLSANTGKQISFLVMAAHNPSGFDENFNGRNLGFLSTSNATPAVIQATQPQGTNGFVVSGAEVEFVNFVRGVNTKTDGTPTGIVANNLSNGTFAPGQQGFHDLNFGRDLTFGFNTEGTVSGLSGVANFFFINVNDSDNSVSAAPGLLGQWTLGSTGNLSFAGVAPVPLPAAVWLLGSALAGVAGVSRRRSA